MLVNALNSIKALGMKYIFIDCISPVADDNVYDVVLHAKYYDSDLSFKNGTKWTEDATSPNERFFMSPELFGRKQNGWR